jgi:hypothetical protein
LVDFGQEFNPMVWHLLVIYHIYGETYSATGNLHQTYERQNVNMFKIKLGYKVKQEKKKESSASKFGYEISMEPAILQLLSAEECVLHIST